MLAQGKLTYISYFRDIHLNDPSYYEWVTDIEVVRYIGREEYLTKIPFSEVQQYVWDMWDNKFCEFLAVHENENDKFVGTAKVNFMNDRGFKNRIADIGIMIGDKNSWGKGLATDVLRTVSNFAFKELGVHKLTAGAMSPNIAVIKAFKRIGFIEEGTLRQQLLKEDGEFCDHILLGCFKSELIDS